MLDTLAASLGSPTITMGTLTAFIRMPPYGLYWHFHELYYSNAAYIDTYELIKKKIKFSSYVYWEIQNGAVAKPNGLLIYREIFAHFLIY